MVKVDAVNNLRFTSNKKRRRIGVYLRNTKFSVDNKRISFDLTPHVAKRLIRVLNKHIEAFAKANN